MARVVCFFVFWIPLTLQAQFTYVLDQDVPVRDANGQTLSFPWAGGLNAAQFNTMDLDGDGADDLVLFDRMANKVITFRNAGNSYVPAPEFENFFPEGLTSWILLRDYNCDGKKDIFTGDILGIKVYRNTTAPGSNPAWEQHLFTTGFPGPKSTVLLTQGTNNKVNLQLQHDDLPAISDIDGDGDLDILNIQYAGHTVEFHQNLSMENNLPCDSLEFKRITRSWGNFRECNCGVFAFDGEACPPNSGGRIQHAGGKSLLALDLNGDQQQDLLFSEAECTSLFFLPNKGTSLDAVMQEFQSFPQTNPVSFVLFPAAYYEDVDFDGKKDLIASPNIFTKEFLNSDLRNSTWFYKNTGSDSHPVFSFVQRNFLQRQMIDVGDNAVPAFADFDGDGDLDLFISTHSSKNYTSTIHKYENTGSASSPAFSLISEDYLGFSASRFYNVKIQFADMDGNQTTDLVFTATNFDNGVTSLHYLNNQSTTGLTFSDITVKPVPFELTSSENLYVTDINGDGLPDILAGRSEGNLEYWKNQGIEGTPTFVLEEENFLGFSATPLRQNITCAVADLDGDGHADLVVGESAGRLGVISDFRDGGSDVRDPDFNLVFNSALQIYSAKNLGGKTWPVVANIFNANKPSIVVGNVLGGIYILRHDEGTSLPDNPRLNVYPNPVAKDEILQVQADRYGTLEVISLLGQRLSSPTILKANELNQYGIPPLAAGLYLLKFTANSRSHVLRLVVK